MARKANLKKKLKARHKKSSAIQVATTTIAEVTCLLESALEHFRRNDFSLAENVYRKVLNHDPINEDALHFIGLIYTQSEQHVELVKFYDLALTKDPESVNIYNNRGISLVYQGEFWLAVASFERALGISSDNADTHINLGSVFNRIGEYEKSLEHYNKALAISPQHTEAHYNLGNTYRKLKLQDEAIACFNRALAIEPQHNDAFYNLCLISRNVCDWSRYSEFESEMIRRAQIPKSTLVPFNLLSWCDDPEVQLACARNYIDGIIPLNIPRFDAVAVAVAVADNGRIKIGYLSSDFRQHVVAQLIVELFELHDRDKFEVFAFSHGPDDSSELSARLVKAVDHFISLGHLSDSDAARLIQQQGVAILVDLNGHSKGARARILAMRPAPIQINYLGYIGTMGASFIDYVVVDKTVVPDDMQPFFTEKLLQLPCYMVHDSQRVIASDALTRVAVGLPDEGFVYCCFNNSYKITPTVFDIWMRCLLAVPGSVLWLVEESAELQRNLRQEAELRGVNSARLIFAARILPAQHLARLRLADLFLDTPVYNAGATACDALWAGLPVLTCQGSSFVSRMGGGLVSAAGVPELVVDTLSEYERRAVELANKPALLLPLREKLITQRDTSLLFDSQQFCNELEKTYLDTWAQWLESPTGKDGPFLDSEEHKAMLKDAMVLHQQGELDAAEMGYRSILKVNPQAADALQLLGVIQAQCGRVQEAIDLYHQALKIDPQLVGAYNNLGVALYGSGSFQQASENFRRAVELRPNAESCFNLGNCFYELKKYDEAILTYQQALAINPNHEGASVNLNASIKALG